MKHCPLLFLFFSFTTTSTIGVEADAEASTFAAKNEPWLQEILTSFGSGIRRPDSERIMLWVNYVAAGVVPGKKILFTVEQVQQFLHAFPRTSVAFVLLPNRAQDLRSSPKWLG